MINLFLFIKKLCVAIAMLTVATASLAWAGFGAHGGDAVFCEGKEPVTLDYYHASRRTGEGAPTLVAIEKFNEDEVLDFLRERFSDMPFGTEFDAALISIGPMKNWIDVPLKDAGDSNEVYNLVRGCQKERAATRQGMDMYLDSTVTDKLSPAQRGLLRAHEALYLFGQKNFGLQSSEKIRALFREVLRKELELSEFERRIKDIGGIPSLVGFTFGSEVFGEADVKLEFTHRDPKTGTITGVAKVSGQEYQPAITIKCSKKGFRDCIYAEQGKHELRKFPVEVKKAGQILEFKFPNGRRLFYLRGILEPVT